MKAVVKYIAAFTVVAAFAIAASFLIADTASAHNSAFEDTCKGSGNFYDHATDQCLPSDDGGASASDGPFLFRSTDVHDSIFRSVTNALLFIVGGLSVIMIIIGGIRFVVSGGDQAAVKAARETIIYAVVGVVVSFMSYALVNFVLTQITDI